MKKYAIDLQPEDVIIDPHTGETIIIELLTRLPDQGKVQVTARYDESGEGWDRTLDFDSQVKVRS